jgi:hypothetical protein
LVASFEASQMPARRMNWSSNAIVAVKPLPNVAV